MKVVLSTRRNLFLCRITGIAVDCITDCRIEVYVLLVVLAGGWANNSKSRCSVLEIMSYKWVAAHLHAFPRISIEIKLICAGTRQKL
jgi:hypothetical protein